MKRIRLESFLGGASIVPLAILFGLNAVDELDRTVFNVLLPEIKDHFDLDLAFVTGIVGFAGLVALLGQLLVGFYGDRGSRKRLVVVGASIWAMFTFSTGLAPTVVVLALMRAGSGLGKAVNDPMHSSLIADYYAPEQRVRAYYWHRIANNVGMIVGPFAGGLIAYYFGWRAPFFVFAVPTVILVVIAARKLHDPVRGRWERQAAGADESLLDLEESPPTFAEAWATAHSVRTLKRIYISLPWFAAAIFGLYAFFSLYYEEVFGMNEAARGFLAAAVEPAQIVGSLYGIKLVSRLFLRDPGLILKLLALGGIGVSTGLLVMAVAPNLGVAIVGNAIASASSAPLTAGLYATMSLVTPPRIRSISFGVAAIWFMPGLLLLPIVGAMADSIGIRGGVALMAPIFLIGSFLIASSGAYVQDDIRRVQAAARARAELRASRLSGDPKLLICRGVEVSYGQTQVLFGVDFDVQEGEVVALLGTNGAGKSTLLKAIAGSVTMGGGAIYYDGTDVGGLDAAAVTALGVALVPGGKGVFPGLTVEENFQLAGWLLHRDGDFVKSAIEESLGYFPVLRERWDAKAGNLSGGEQQMLTIAMALLARPKLLMIDELSLGLAPIVVEMLLEVVREISKRGVTVILVEQSVNVALTLAERAVFMEKGEVRFDGPTAELLERPDVLRSVFLEGAAAAIEAPADGLAEPFAVDHVRYELPRDRRGNVKAPALSVRDLSVAFGGIRAVDGVDLDVYDGQILGLIGPNGAGKTTIFDLICGLLAADSGNVRLHGKDISRLSADARGRLGLGRSFQDARLFPSMTVRETIAVALERHIAVRDPLAAVLASPATRAAEREIEGKVDRLIELMRLNAFANKFIFELSTGSRRIVDLACTLAHEPTVLLLDEPSSGIAQRETEALGPLLLDIRDETGAALMVIEHDMPLITAISDHMIALELGAVLVQGEPQDVVSDPRVVASYLGTTEETIHRSGDLHRAMAHTDDGPNDGDGGVPTRAMKASRASKGSRASSGSKGSDSRGKRRAPLSAKGTTTGGGNGSTERARPTRDEEVTTVAQRR